MTTPLFPSVIAWNVLDGGTDAQDGNNYPGPALQDYAAAVVGAAGYPLPVAFSASVSTQTAQLVPGEHYSFPIPQAGTYRVDSEMDVLVKSSDSSAVYGAELSRDADAYSTTLGSLSAQSGLDFGDSSFSFEAWVQCDAALPNGGRVIGFGGASGAAKLDVYFTNASSPNVRLGCELLGNSGTSIVNNTAASALSDTYPLSGRLYHLVVVFLRAAGAGTGRVRYYINGVQVQESTWTEAGTPTTFNLSSVTSSGRLVIGGTVGANAEWDGRIEDLKFYNVALSVTQITNRTAAGPVRSIGMDSADANLTWWVSFQNSGSWSNSLHPECIGGYGNSVFNSLIASPAITERTGGAPASLLNSARIFAGRPEPVYCSGAYLNVWGDSASGGRVRVTPVI